MKPIILLFLIFSFATAQNCAKGCLMCNSSNQCQFCDSTQNYVQSGSTCAKSSATNCAVLVQNGSCAICSSSHYAESSTGNCVAVPNESIVQNCAIYSSSTVCSVCSLDYFLSGTTCTAVSTKVQDCKVYSADNTCLRCRNNFILSFDGKTCISTSSVSNCLKYTYASCSKCKANYILDKNSYTKNFDSVSYLDSLLSISAHSEVSGTQNAVQLSVCQSGNIINCLIYSDSVTCSGCVLGFFLEKNVCVRNPSSQINQCKIYSNISTCTDCNTGYFLSANSCQAVTDITDCTTYATNQDPLQCLACATGKFVQGNACTDRVNSATINECKTFSATADTCAVCNDNFALTADSRKCLAATTNCKTYAGGTTFESTSIVCSACNHPNYLDETQNPPVCTKGTDTNCAAFTRNADTCTACNNRFYLSGTTCLSHTNIQNCKTYHATEKNECSVCATGYYNFKYTNVCRAVATISGCLTYSNDGTSCDTCVDGKYFSGNSCPDIPSNLSNCASYLDPNCSKCNADYMINKIVAPQDCIPPISYLTGLCITKNPVGVASWGGDSNNPIVCDYCSPNARAYTPAKSEAICVQTSQLSLYQASATVAGCIRYGNSYAASPKLICMECEAGKFLSGYALDVSAIVATSCVSSCPNIPTKKYTLVDDLLGSVHICMDPAGDLTSTTCLKFIRTATHAITANEYSCIQTSADHLPSISFVSSSVVFDQNTAVVGDQVAISSEYSNGFTIEDGDTTGLTPSVFNYYGFKFTPNNYVANGGISTDNCKLLWTIGSSSYKGSAYKVGGALGAYNALVNPTIGCMRCTFGYHPQFMVTSNTGNLVIPNCVSMQSTCQSSAVVKGGLPTYLNYLFSCHDCAQSAGQNSYPTIYMEIDAVAASAKKGIFLQFTPPAVASNVAVSTQGFRCANVPSSLTRIEAGSGPFAVNNCAAYGVLTLRTAYSNDTGNTQNYCLACAHGYFPIYLSTPGGGLSATYSNSPPYAVKSCNASNKCDAQAQNKPFNSCGACTKSDESLSTPIYYGYTDFRLVNCLQASSQNCFILAQGSSALSSSTAHDCFICMPGYYLNEDKKCEKLSPSNMTVGGSFNIAYLSSHYVASRLGGGGVANGYDRNLIRNYFLMSFWGRATGVSGCDINFIKATPSVLAPTICMKSSFLTAGSIPASGTAFVQFCLQYKIKKNAENFLCLSCASGYIPTSDSRKCVTVLPSCLQAQTSPNEGLCAKCQDSFRNVNGLCSTQVIQNCSTYVNAPDSYTQTVMLCSVCSSGYYKNTGQTSCTKGSLANCKTYEVNSATSCTACETGFTLLTLSGSISYCYPIPTSLNCFVLADQSASIENNAQISCTSCASTNNQQFGIKSFNDIKTPTDPKTICMPFTAVKSCQSYAQSNTVLASNTFDCTECLPGFYYLSTTKACETRKNQPQACTSYNPTADKCSGCSSGFFLSSDQKTCEAYPNGIFNCAEYTSATLCKTCARTYYLSGNRCIQSTLIDGCDVYLGNNVCKSCVAGRFLQNPITCAVATASNCLTYTSATICASCPINSVLTPNGQITNCVEATVDNCASVDATSTPASCIECNDNHFLTSTKTCQPTTKNIANCLKYDSATTCSRCQDNFILGADRGTCTQGVHASAIDPNCIQSAVSNTPFCAVCALGYFFKDGECQACTDQNKAKGCASCNPKDQAQCLFCSSGWYMDSNKKCINANPVIPPTVVTPPTQSAKIVGGILIYFMLIVL